MSTKRSKLTIPLMLLAGAACFVMTIVVVVGGAYFFSPKQQGSDEERVLSLYMAVSKTSVEAMEKAGYEEVIKEVKIDGNWAIVEAVAVETKTGEPVSGIVEVFHRRFGRWYSSFDNPQLRASWVDQVPESLIPAESKEHLR